MCFKTIENKPHPYNTTRDPSTMSKRTITSPYFTPDREKKVKTSPYFNSPEKTRGLSIEWKPKTIPPTQPIRRKMDPISARKAMRNYIATISDADLYALDSKLNNRECHEKIKKDEVLVSIQVTKDGNTQKRSFIIDLI
jgi:hypothetical protein